MLESFQDHLDTRFPFLRKSRLLLAVSGGLDSMAMCDLFLKSGFDVSLAHCNFTLRGNESDADERFVADYAQRNGLMLHHTRFDTRAFAADNRLSIQLAARQLRYMWFDELLEKFKYDYLLTAHHADDNIETFLINLSRRSGIGGLSGIPEQNGKIVRPLLPFYRHDLEQYVRSQRIEWREDSSNASGDYLRNRIRQRLIPVLNDTVPGFADAIGESLKNLNMARRMADDAAHLVYKEVAVELPGKTLFKCAELTRLEHYAAYLHHWFAPYGFTAWNDIYALVDATSGKQILSATHRLVKDREVLILETLKQPSDEVVLIDVGTNEVASPLRLQFSMVDAVKDAGDNRIFADADLLQFPLTLRRWQAGDVFVPFGMRGSKKVSKFLKDEKVSLPDKDAVWVLCSGETILWVIGRRMSDLFKVTDATQNIIRIDFIP